MTRTLDDLPYRAMRELCVVITDEIGTEIAEHVEDYHLPSAKHGPLRAAPWPKERISDVELAKMTEAIEAEGLTLQELCERFARPMSLVMRELKVYERRHARWVVQYAWASEFSGEG